MVRPAVRPVFERDDWKTMADRTVRFRDVECSNSHAFAFGHEAVKGRLKMPATYVQTKDGGDVLSLKRQIPSVWDFEMVEMYFR